MPAASATLNALKTAYEEHRGYVLGVLARRCGWLDASEQEAVFHDAYAVMLEKERDGALELEAMDPRQVRAYLTQTAINKALDEGKRAERKRTEPIGERVLVQPDLAPPPDEAAAVRQERAFVREIVSGLPARRQTIVKLRFFFDRTPEEIQRMMAITSRTYRRELERGVRHIGERFELVRAGTFCDSRRDLILAYVSDGAESKDAAEAREHLANCPGCARWAADLRQAARDVASVLPLPALVSGHTVSERLADAATTVHDAFGAALAAGKHHLMALIGRLDPGAAGYASTARPGATAALVAGCIAVGGGATYCVVNMASAPGASLFGDVEAPHLPERRAVPPPEQRSQNRARTEATATTSPAATLAPAPASDDSDSDGDVTAQPRSSESGSESTSESASESAPVVTEFGAEGSGVSVAPTGAETSSTSSDSSSGSSSSKGSSAPPGEFDP